MATAPVITHQAIGAAASSDTGADRALATDLAGSELFIEGFTVLRAAHTPDRFTPETLSSFQALWDDLALDQNLGGSTYRYRRYGRVRAEITASEPEFTPLAHSVFQQSAEHIPIHMGRARLFEPVAQEHLSHPVLLGLLADGLRLIRSGDDRTQWEIGLHFVRTIAGATPGLPTPEGRHRDGHDYIGMHLLGRRGCTGGESIVYRDGRPDTRLTLLDPLDGMVVVDAAIMHEVTPIAATDGEGVRDMLLVDYNAIGPAAGESRP
ncbi:2OG-Fe dioxygenase family protein [Streptomyces sp. NPDC056486]|uniref:2OG-Fe dioxygenase family protein n=1 Tax=Streptomyces sp. NPDC056486 TaxID=3345835 RepID=UPI003689EBF2